MFNKRIFIIKKNTAERGVYFMLGRIGMAEMLIVPFTFIIPAIILYFIIKLAVKQAIRELKKDGTI